MLLPDWNHTHWWTKQKRENGEIFAEKCAEATRAATRFAGCDQKSIRRSGKGEAIDELSSSLLEPAEVSVFL